jgi:hypothetical protein
LKYNGIGEIIERESETEGPGGREGEEGREGKK